MEIKEPPPLVVSNEVGIEFLQFLIFLLYNGKNPILPPTSTTPSFITTLPPEDRCSAMNLFLYDLEHRIDHGVEHIAALSDELMRPIIVFHGPDDHHYCGAMFRNWPPILLRYFPPDQQNPRGHYVPFGESENWCVDSDNCLFHAVAHQLKKPVDVEELKTRTIARMKKNPDKYAELDVRIYNGECTLLLGGAQRQFITSQRVIDLIPRLFPHYTRVYPPDTDISGQANAAEWHIVNRFEYSWVLMRMVGDRLRSVLGVEPFIGGPSTCQDQLSKQGRLIHACHIVRVNVNPVLRTLYPRLYQVLTELVAITENEHRDINLTHLFGGAIDFFSQELLVQGERRLDYFNYQDNFLEFVRDIGRRNEHVVVRRAADEVIQNWPQIVTNEQRFRDMLKILLDYITAESGVKIN